MPEQPHKIDRRDLLRGAALTGCGLGSPQRSSADDDATGVRTDATPITSVDPHLNMPTFVLAGQPYTRPVFETYNPQQKYFDQMAAAGCEVMSFSASFGRYALSQPMWTAAGSGISATSTIAQHGSSPPVRTPGSCRGSTWARPRGGSRNILRISRCCTMGRPSTHPRCRPRFPRTNPSPRSRRRAGKATWRRALSG